MIYHIAEKSLWKLAKTAGIYEPESLSAEGFIHCCTEDLFPQVVNFYFKGRADLVLLEVDDMKLKAEVRWEKEGPHKFPHIYGALDVDAVVREADLELNKDGLFDFPFKRVLH